MNLIAIVALSVTACVIIVVLVLVANQKSEKRGDEGRRGGASGGIGHVAANRKADHQTLSFKATKTDESVESKVPLVSCKGRTVPSPERPVTDTDAVIVDLIRQAPELPSAVLELSRALRDPEANLHSIVELVSTDPVLSAKILRVTNSAAYSLQKITSLQQAIVLLGFQNIWILVNQLMTSKVLQPFARIEREEMAVLWKHAAAVAVCAKQILLSAGYVTHEIAPTVLTCALMHDVGKFLLRGLQPVRKENDDLQEGQQAILPTVIDEEGRYGINHCRLGYLLSTYWKLPEQVCTTIGFHHHASFDNYKEIPRHVLPVVAMVALADSVAGAAGYHDGRPVAITVLPEVLESAGLVLDPDPVSYLNHSLLKDLKHMEVLTQSSAAEM